MPLFITFNKTLKMCKELSALSSRGANSKDAKNGFPQNIFANTLLQNYTQIVILQIRFPSHTLPTEE